MARYLKTQFKQIVMKKFSFLFSLLFLVATSTQAQILQNILNQITNSSGQKVSADEVGKGIKEALSIGSKNAGANANKVDGYFKNPAIKIPFPKEVNEVQTRLKQMGMTKLVDDFVLTLNRSAETAAKEAAPIFVNAITQMTITDAIGLFKGGDNAATEFLKKTTSTQLFAAFLPHVKTALAKTNCTKYWSKITTNYNKVPLVKPVQTDLAKYTTNKALEGLFLLVSQEELKIRKDPGSRVTELLRRVFG